MTGWSGWTSSQAGTQLLRMGRRKRRERLLQQGAFICCLLFSVWCLAGVLHGAGRGKSSRDRSAESDAATWRNRKLMASGNASIERNCTEPAINEFPDDLFNIKERQKGAVLLHIFCALYMFYALAIVCDDFFVPSLEKICERLHLSEDVAGATFMAAGSSTPELFASVIGVFITHGDVGVGTIVGSAVFNILCIIGVCGVFAGQVVRLTWWSLFRDSMYYILAIIALIIFIYDEVIVWWESLILIVMYLIYILIMKYNMKMQHLFTIKRKNIGNGTIGSELQDGNVYSDPLCDDPTVPLLWKVRAEQHYNGRNSVVMVDEIICSSPPKYRFPEAGLRIMITNKFPPRTRLRMASRIIINERQRLLQSGNGMSMMDLDGKQELLENGLLHGDKDDYQEDNDATTYLVPFSIPSGCVNQFKWAFSWPLICVLYFTIPNSSRPRWENFFMLTFILSTVWIAIFSYIMVWMVTVIGYTLGIPDVIMGITFLAAGTSVPDCMASLIVARQGLGDMAVSNTIGSNVFDILVGLGVPWGIQTMIIHSGSTVKINSKGLVYSVILLLGSVALTVIGVHVNNWKLDKKLGYYVLCLYAIFLCFSVLIEYNVFTFVNLPMCRDDF